MKRRGIVIELTALLDVILLMLFLLLGQIQTRVEQAEASVQQAETETAEAAADADTARREAEQLRLQLEEAEDLLSRSQREELTLGIVAENSTVLTLSVQAGSVRRIRVEPAGEQAVYLTFGRGWEETMPQRLGDLLLGTLAHRDHESAFLVFQYDRGAIYHAEYEMISGVIRQLKDDLSREGVALNIIETDLTEQTEKGD